MLDENEIVDAVCNYLVAKGYTIIERLRTTQHGIDITAKQSSETGRLLIEAKGGTSTRLGSARFGRSYDTSQVFDRVAKGLYTAAKMRCEHWKNNDKVALAFPDTDTFRKYVDPISPVLKKLEISVFVVSPDKRVVKL